MIEIKLKIHDEIFSSLRVRVTRKGNVANIMDGGKKSDDGASYLGKSNVL